MDAVGALSLLRRRWIPLLLCVLAGIAGALVVTQQAPRVYSASTSLIINIPDARTSQEALQGVQLSGQLLQSYAAIATSRTAAERVKAELDLAEPVDVVRGKLGAAPVPETLLLSITATDLNRDRAREIADSASSVFIQSVADLEQNKAEKIEPRVVDPAVASAAPVSPRPKVNLAVGLFLGLVIGAALALLLEALDRSVKTPKQAEDGFEAPVLALVPRAAGKEDAAAAMARAPRGPASEAYRGLRTAVRFIRPDDPLRTLLVTSPSAGEGKTTTASNLAIALAQAGERVILVDADLRRGRVADALGLPGGVGLTSVITRRAGLQDALQEWGGLLYVLGTGPLPPNPSEILGSESMAQMLEDLAGMADIVVIDTAPVLPVTDAVVLAAQVDGVVLVARAGQTERTSAHAARRRLNAVNAHVVGSVLNGVGASTAGYYEGYQYVPSGTNEEQAVPAGPAA